MTHSTLERELNLGAGHPDPIPCSVTVSLIAQNFISHFKMGYN